jgi:C4-dicarboxylate-binding protein DctP
MYKIILILFIFTKIVYAETIIRFSHVVSVDSPKGVAVEKFKNELEKISSGKIKVLVYPDGVLFDDIPVIDALQKNIVQMAAPSFSKFSGKISDFQVFDIPFLFNNIDQIHNFYTSKAVEILQKRSEEYGIKILAFWDNDFKHITCRHKLIKKPEELKGLKVRTMGSDILNTQFNLTGAISYTYPFSSLKQILEERLIDCQENTFNNIYSQKLYLNQKYLTISAHGYLGYAVVISKKFWESLSQIEKSQILEALENTTKFEQQFALKKNNTDYFRLTTNKNITVYKLSIEEREYWKAFYKKYRSNFIKYLSGEMIKELETMGLY